MDPQRGNRLALHVTRAFFKANVPSPAVPKWFELDMESIKGGADPKITETPGAGLRYAVPGVPMAKFSGKLWLSDELNYAATPYFLANKATGQLQIFITGSSDARKHVLNCIVKLGDGDDIFAHEGAQSVEIEFQQCGAYYAPGDTIPSGAADTFATINPTNLPPLMPPASGA